MTTKITITSESNHWPVHASQIGIDLLNRGYDVRFVQIEAEEADTIQWEPVFKPGDRVRFVEDCGDSTDTATVIESGRQWSGNAMHYKIHCDANGGSWWISESEIVAAEDAPDPKVTDETFDLSMTVTPEAWARAFANGLPKAGSEDPYRPETNRQAIARVLRQLADEIDGTSEWGWGHSRTRPVFINGERVGSMTIEEAGK